MLFSCRYLHRRKSSSSKSSVGLSSASRALRHSTSARMISRSSKSFTLIFIFFIDILPHHDLLCTAADVVHPSDPLHHILGLELLGHALSLGILPDQPEEHRLALLVHAVQVLVQRSACPQARQQRTAAFPQMPELCSAKASQVVTLFFGQLQVGNVVVPSERIADPCPLVCDVLFQFHKKIPPFQVHCTR